MILLLAVLPESLRGPDGPDYKGRVPRRARFLEPDAAASLLKLVAKCPWLVFTDVYRSPEASLAARRSKRGVQPPGFSAHNFGFAFDLDVGACLRGGKLRYAELLEELAAFFWFCHRRDLDQTAAESWHFNYLGERAPELLDLTDLDAPGTWSRPVERRIVDEYGASFALSDAGVQRALAGLGMYRGDADGKLGPLSREAVGAFQRAWGLADDGVAGPRTRRVIAVVSAQVELVSPSPA